MKRLSDVKYTYKSLSVPGGGFVTGFLFHSLQKGILYARTDIGGIYKYDFELSRWKSLSSRFTEYERHLLQPLSLALDEEHGNVLFAMCGSYGRMGGKSAFLISKDYGETFTEKQVPFMCNGNSPARSTGERLAYRKGKLFFGSQGEGLWRSDNEGDSWERLPFSEENITFVYFASNDAMIVSCTGETFATGNDRGHTLYVSYDFGYSFQQLTAPAPLNDERCGHNGFVGYSITADKDKIYITFSHSYKENQWGGWNDFACDNGGGFDGRLWQYRMSDKRIEFEKDITPVIKDFSDENPARCLPFGLGGVAVNDDIIAVCSVGGHGDAIFISRDSGENYSIIKSTDLELFDIDVPYLKPQYNGGRIPLHWTSCLRIDPFNPDFAVVNTGTGIFALKNLTSNPRIATLCNGIEETVHMNIYGLPGGKNNVIDLVGDLGGFAFSNLDKPCENSFADEHRNRYITCLNADYLQNNPDVFISTARGNWTGQTKGGVIMTTDGGESFTHIGYPVGMSSKIDEAIERIKRPNSNSGWSALTSDGKSILWTIAYKLRDLPCFTAVKYDIATKKFTKIRVYDKEKNDISESECQIKLFTDRINSRKAYGFGEKGQLYISNDGGESFYQAKIIGDFPEYMMSGIDGWKNSEIRFLPTREGECYAALLNHGLWKLSFGEQSVTAERISAEGDFVKTVGFGKGERTDVPALFISGTIMGEYGFWRSFDNGESWAKINDEMQMFGNIVSMDGDMKNKGRVYIATGNCGGLYGDECK